MLKKIIFSNLFILLFFNVLIADSLRISQIDSYSLLLNQEINLYVSVTDDNGKPITDLKEGNFSIFESSNRKQFTPIDTVTGFKTKANYESGINFLLLIDNSGSMYRTLSGKRTKEKSKMRIAYAKRAAVSFLGSITNPKDKVGIVSYNSFYTSYSKPISNKMEIEKFLDEIKEPSKDERYTEIYSSLYLAVDEFRSIRGRKAIIILSDGENQPYSKYTKKKHPVFGWKRFKYTEPVNDCQREGISVFPIYFGKRGGKKDKNLSKIAVQTGGSVFSAHNQEELNKIYENIVNQILNEYLITYKATMEPSDKKYVKVECSSNDSRNSVTRFYFSSTVFGVPIEDPTPLLLIPFLLAIFLLWLLSRFDFQKTKGSPSLEVLNAGAAKTSTQVLSLGAGKTVIGGDQSADMTIVGGVSNIKEQHATVIYNEKNKKYTIAGDGNFMVNNKSVKTKVLEPGDVINIAGTTVVFDDGDVD
ncbi:MAG: VWA domain-containing protein [Spirochaetota bacterium]|nr:VWA domain-containing protein [Spirochaetota bacterium]